MSTTMSAVHAGLVALVDAVPGMAQSPVPFRSDVVPDGLSNGYFYVEPVVVDVGAQAGGMGIDSATFQVVFLWRLTMSPNSGAQAAMDKANQIRDALTVDPVAEARVYVTSVDYEFDLHHAIVSIETVARYTVRYP